MTALLFYQDNLLLTKPENDDAAGIHDGDDDIFSIAPSCHCAMMMTTTNGNNFTAPNPKTKSS